MRQLKPSVESVDVSEEMKQLDRLQHDESEILARDYHIDFRESQYRKGTHSYIHNEGVEFEELDRDVLRSEDMSYLPNYSQGPMTGSQMEAEAEYQALVKGEDSHKVS